MSSLPPDLAIRAGPHAGRTLTNSKGQPKHTFPPTCPEQGPKALPEGSLFVLCTSPNMFAFGATVARRCLTCREGPTRLVFRLGRVGSCLFQSRNQPGPHTLSKLQASRGFCCTWLAPPPLNFPPGLCHGKTKAKHKAKALPGHRQVPLMSLQPPQILALGLGISSIYFFLFPHGDF